MNYEKIIEDELKYVKKEIETEIGKKYTLLELCHLANNLGLDTENVDEPQVCSDSMQDNFTTSIAYYLKFDDVDIMDYYVESYFEGAVNIVIEKFDKTQDINQEEFFALDSEWIIKEVEIL